MSERKDIDAIVGATVKLEESLNKRISELEKKYSDISDLYVQLEEENGDRCREIAELREKIGANTQKDNEEWTQFFEWKREFEGLFHKDWKDLIKTELTELKEKLDGKASGGEG